MINKKVVFILIVLFITAFLYISKIAHHSTLHTNKTIYSNKTSTSNNSLKIQISFSDCIPIKDINQLRNLLNQTYNYTIFNSTINVTFFYLSYKYQTNIFYKVNITHNQFLGTSLLINIYEKTNETERSYRYAKCVRKVNVLIFNYPKNVYHIRIEPYRIWKNVSYWGGITINIPIKR